MNYNKIIKEVRKIMKNTTATRYWGTLILLLLGIVLFQLSNIINAVTHLIEVVK